MGGYTGGQRRKAEEPLAKRPFIVFALPRSRTAWASHYLSYDGERVEHDTAIHCEVPTDFLANFAKGMRGCAETGAVIGWRFILSKLPQAKIAVIHRPLEEIKRSLAKLGMQTIEGELETRYAMLAELAQTKDIERFEFHELNAPKHRRRLFEYCLEREWDQAWDDKSAPLNIQIDMSERLRFLASHSQQLTALKGHVASLQGHAYGG